MGCATQGSGRWALLKAERKTLTATPLLRYAGTRVRAGCAPVHAGIVEALCSFLFVFPWHDAYEIIHLVLLRSSPLAQVTDSWLWTNPRDGFRRCRFLLQRLPDQAPMPRRPVRLPACAALHATVPPITSMQVLLPLCARQLRAATGGSRHASVICTCVAHSGPARRLKLACQHDWGMRAARRPRPPPPKPEPCLALHYNHGCSCTSEGSRVLSAPTSCSSCARKRCGRASWVAACWPTCAGARPAWLLGMACCGVARPVPPPHDPACSRLNSMLACCRAALGWTWQLGF